MFVSKFSSQALNFRHFWSKSPGTAPLSHYLLEFDHWYEYVLLRQWLYSQSLADVAADIVECLQQRFIQPCMAE